MTKRALLNLLTTSAAVAATVGLFTPMASAQQKVHSRSYDAIELRGYGNVSAQSYVSVGPAGASHTVIQCESDAKAKLTQAKYLSDLSALPGVRRIRIAIDQTTVHGSSVEGQGCISALREGRQVHIVAAKTEDDLQTVVRQRLSQQLRSAVSQAEVAVPMWLDRWDRYGFRFYHRSWETPPGSDSSKYDHVAEFDYAKKQQAGLVIWTEHLDLDTPEGMNNEAWWDWTIDAARDRGLPVGLNITVGNPTWLVNRYRDQTQLKMPQFSGNWHKIGDPNLGGTGIISYAATEAKEKQLDLCRQVLLRFGKDENVTTILEPHGELSLGEHRSLLEYGPASDESFRTYLQQKFRNLSTLRERWGKNLRGWDDVNVPELASLAGWNEDAMDLSGQWKVMYEPLPAGVKYDHKLLNEIKFMDSIETRGTPAQWMAADFDDSDWPTLTAPGHDALMHLEHRPAVYRRSFEVDANWRRRHEKLWLYVWDLNLATGDEFKVSVNESVVGNDRLDFNVPHWGAYDVSDALRPGTNSIAIRLPKGLLAYRVYLSAEPPRQYPDLGPHRNAQWVDFSDWVNWVRVQAARRGMEMIREVDPQRQIVLMAPDKDNDAISQLALEFGGNFHNTGWMGAFWGDLLPALMRGARLPFSLEPGGPANDLREFKQMLGRYFTEGIQGIDYFIHIGSVMWKPEIREHFEAQKNLIGMTGTYHSPRAQVAALYSDRNSNLTSFPWGNDPNTNLGGGYWKWNVRANLVDKYESDGLTPSSFTRGDADRYRVIIDTNTSIMDSDLLTEIEAYVRAGGTFVTWAQTGRHSPTEKDTWPISRLTGYEVVAVDPHDPSGAPARSRPIYPAPNQSVFSGDWSSTKANGLTLRPAAADVRNLMLWDDGSVAIGARRLGKGIVMHVGCKFAGASMFDRIGPGPIDQATLARSRLLESILDWRAIPRVPAKLQQPSNQVFLRHYVSNNGLYNVWSLWNRDQKNEVVVQLKLDDSVGADSGIAVRDKKAIPFSNGQTALTIAPGWSRMLLTPRNRIGEAPQQWLQLQRDWWRGTRVPQRHNNSASPARWALDLGKDWRFRPLAGNEDASKWAGDVDDSTWESMRLGVWGAIDHPDVSRAVLRRRFQVPKSWADGKTGLWLTGFFGTTFKERARIWLDGKLIQDWNSFGIVGVNPEESLTPGSQHTIAVEIQGEGRVTGSRGSCWLSHWPKAVDSIDLAGEWDQSRNILSFADRVSLPGAYDGQSLRRRIRIPSRFRGKNLVLQVKASGPLVGAIINGSFVRRIHREHHNFGERFDLNITPWIQFDSDNEIQLVTWQGPAQGDVRRISIGSFDRGVYP